MPDIDRDALYSARHALLTGSPVTGKPLGALLGHLLPVLGPPPAAYEIDYETGTVTANVPGNSVEIAPPVPSDPAIDLHKPANWLFPGPDFPVVGKCLSRAGFRQHCQGLTGAWKPVGLVIHNTAAPSLATRPQGILPAHMGSFRDYYRNKQKWKAGPHLFVDDNGIWLFSPLDRRGTHSPSWNATHVGMELLGDFDTEDPWSGRGAAVLRNAMAAARALLDHFDLPNSAVKFHKEDPATDHACPGKKLTKARFLEELANYHG